jgi:hypothetical protein
MNRFNPLHPFEARFIGAFRKKGVRAFVKQTYSRGERSMEGQERKGYVLIHFERMLAAQQYFDVVKEDPARELLNIDEPADVERIHELIETTNIYTMLTIKDAAARAQKLLDKRLRYYIEKKLSWFPSRNDEVQFSLDVQFGEVYAKLKFRSREVKVKLEDIESSL